MKCTASISHQNSNTLVSTGYTISTKARLYLLEHKMYYCTPRIHFLHWIEAISLLGLISEVGMLRLLSTLTLVYNLVDS